MSGGWREMRKQKAWEVGEWRWTYEPGDGSFEYARLNADGSYTCTNQEPEEFQKEPVCQGLKYE